MVSGQKPRLTKDGKSFIWKTDNFVPLVVPGVIHQFWERFVVYIATPQDSSSSSSSPVLEPSDGLDPGNWCDPSKTQNKNEKRDDSRDSDDPLADLPERLEEFKENQVDTELPASAHSCPESDLEHPATVVSESRKHSIFVTSQKTEIAKSAWEPK